MKDMDRCFDQLIDLADVNRQQPDLPKAPQMLAAPAGTRILDPGRTISDRAWRFFRHLPHYNAR